IEFDEARDSLFSYYAQGAKERGATQGVHRFIQNAKKAGLKLALATGGVAKKVEINLEAIGLEASDFDVVITGDKVKRNKPNPDIYQLAALSMGLPTGECLVIEDALNGIEAGKKAGCSVCALTTSFSVAALASAGAEYVMSSLDAFEDYSSVAQLMSLLDASKGHDERTLYGANMILQAKQSLQSKQQLLDLAIDMAYKTRKQAYTPYSNYKVGAAVISCATNRVYSGCNVENSSYGATICAERNAILAAVAQEGVIGISTVVVVSEDNPPAPPCAMCLQVLSEFCRPETEIHLLDVVAAEGGAGSHLLYKFSELLPHPFIFPSMRHS
ncbi:MAG: cytidine deaminase, partial [Spirochaetia bacterium]|nr:cytidine deaminase [Spirochaetia bacterium]